MSKPSCPCENYCKMYPQGGVCRAQAILDGEPQPEDKLPATCLTLGGDSAIVPVSLPKKGTP